jgi:hypothetical protein
MPSQIEVPIKTGQNNQAKKLIAGSSYEYAAVIPNKNIPPLINPNIIRACLLCTVVLWYGFS